jgi:hypothetical protein
MSCHAYSDRFKGGDFLRCSSLTALDNRPGVPHPFAGRGRLARNESCHRFAHVPGDVLRSSLLVHTTDLADQDHLLRLGILLKESQHFDEIRAYDGISADADGG